MSHYNDEAFGGFWDLGESLLPDLISLPIKALIRKDAAKAGIDMRNPIRSIAQVIASGYMSKILLPFLGPFGAIIGGLLGYAVATGASYPGDRPHCRLSPEEEAWYTLKLKAISVAVDATKEHTTDQTWNQIQTNVYKAIDYVEANVPEPSSMKEAYAIMMEYVLAAIKHMDINIYREFILVQRAAEGELGLA